MISQATSTQTNWATEYPISLSYFFSITPCLTRSTLSPHCHAIIPSQRVLLFSHRHAFHRPRSPSPGHALRLHGRAHCMILTAISRPTFRPPSFYSKFTAAVLAGIKEECPCLDIVRLFTSSFGTQATRPPIFARELDRLTAFSDILRYH